MLARIRKAREEREGGFTLIELLVVIIIIGILAAIAIPVFLNQRKKGYDSQAKSDVRNAATAEETVLTDSNPAAYTTTAATVQAAGFKASNNVATYATVDAGIAYCLTSNNSNSTNWFLYDSNNGGLSGPYADQATAQAACTDAVAKAATPAKVSP
jgi:prepilin-type N-terminal cleavage/methylation domain-containing protein